MQILDWLVYLLEHPILILLGLNFLMAYLALFFSFVILNSNDASHVDSHEQTKE